MKKKTKYISTQYKNSEDLGHSLITKYKFCKKKHGPNQCCYLKTDYHYYHKTGYIAKFYKKKLSPQVNSRKVVICIIKHILRFQYTKA